MTDDPLLPQATDDPTIVAGRYELERSLGTGGMGEVFVATDRTLDRPVALKRLPGALTDDPDARKRFFREAQALARINDPNVVSVFDAGEDDGRPFLVMELVQGATVADELRAGARFTPERASAIGAGTAGGLAAAHAQGVVHRDVKPSNIFLTAKDHPKVGDFGIARVERGDMTLTMTGQAFGSPPYIAPEQATGGPVDARADLYALGCVLYHMLAGHPPFEGDDSVAVTYQHVHTVAPTLEELGVGVSPELSTLVASLMRKGPSARPKSADAVRMALESRPASAPLPPAPGLASPDDRTRVIPQRASRTPEPRRRWIWPARCRRGRARRDRRVRAHTRRYPCGRCRRLALAPRLVTTGVNRTAVDRAVRGQHRCRADHAAAGSLGGDAAWPTHWKRMARSTRAWRRRSATA